MRGGGGHLSEGENGGLHLPEVEVGLPDHHRRHHHPGELEHHQVPQALLPCRQARTPAPPCPAEGRLVLAGEELLQQECRTVTGQPGLRGFGEQVNR